jgi:hypothetical protein
VLNKAKSLESQGFQCQLSLFKCKVFAHFCAKALHFPLAWRSTPMELRIAAMSEFHKNAVFMELHGIRRVNKPQSGLFC